MSLRIFLVAVLLVAPLCRADAYGPIGHQIVGAIADTRLANTPTGAKVTALLDGFTLQKAAVVPDEIKGWDKRGADDPGIFHYSSKPRIDAQLRDFWRANPPTQDRNSPIPSHHWFHYTDVPILDLEKYADGKTGRTQWDIVHMIRFCVRVLRGAEPEVNARKITKPIAVILLAHYVGDIHQPLHVGAEYFDQQGHAVDPDKGQAGIEDQGGNTIVLMLKTPAGITGNRNSKLHGFWDNDAVMANLPALPPEMPKEERRAKIDEARAQLVRELASQPPKSWQLSAGTPLENCGEAWADEILPIAREAHQRLEFQGVHPVKDENGGVAAAGAALEIAAPDHVAYRDWSAHVAREELHKAGWRLADLLEKSL